jgi:hypothetical protein
MNTSKFGADGATFKDTLGREKFAKELAYNLVNSFPNGSESIVLGITGNWGNGKSSFLNFVEREISHLKGKSEGSTIILCSFKPWTLNGIENITAEFYKLLNTKLGNENETLRKRFSKIYESTSNYRKLIPKTKLLGFALKSFDKVVKSALEEPDNESIKSDINKILKRENIQLIITIDEIDRLEGEDILSLFKLVKSNCSFTNTRYILCFDKTQVLSLIDKKYTGSDTNYLEKIVQIEFPLPAIQKHRLLSIVKENLREFEQRHGIKFDNDFIELCWDIYGLQHIISNIREIKRLINSLTLRLPSIKNEVNPTDFFILEVIRLNSHRLYLQVYEGILSEFEYSHSDKSLRGNWTKQLENKNVGRLLDALRDKLPTYVYSKISEKRLFEHKYYKRYFTLQISQNEIKDEELKNYLTNTSRRIDLLKSFNKNHKTEDFLEQLRNPKLNPEFIKNIGGDVFMQLLEIENHISFDQRLWITLSEAIFNLLILKKIQTEVIKSIFNLTNGSIGPNFCELMVNHWFIGEIKKREKSNQLFKETPDYELFEKLIYLKEGFEDRFDRLLQECFNDLVKQEKYRNHSFDNPYMDFLIPQYLKKYPNQYDTFLKETINNPSRFKSYVIFLVDKVIIKWGIDKLRIISWIEGYEKVVNNDKKLLIKTLKSIERAETFDVQFLKIEKCLEAFSENDILFDPTQPQ